MNLWQQNFDAELKLLRQHIEAERKVILDKIIQHQTDRRLHLQDQLTQMEKTATIARNYCFNHDDSH